MVGTANSGPHKRPTVTAQEAVERLKALSPRAFEVIKEDLDIKRNVDTAWKVVEHIKGKAPQTIDSNVNMNQANPFEGVSLEEVRALVAFLKAHPGDMELLLAQARAEATQPLPLVVTPDRPGKA